MTSKLLKVLSFIVFTNIITSGFAFIEDDSKFSTWDGGHINNFRIPMVFFHPNIPRVHLAVNATTMSVLPTVLDLLASSGSLNDADRAVASRLVDEYEAQSLIREYAVEDARDGTQQWIFSLMCPGGNYLSVASAARPWRLVMPLCTSDMLRFTDLDRHDQEQDKLDAWSVPELAALVASEYGAEAAQWLRDAEAVATWWYWERRRLWKFGGSSWQARPQIPIIGDFLNQTFNQAARPAASSS